MPEETNEARQALLTDAFVVGVGNAAEIQDSASCEEAIFELDGPSERLDDGYPDWHPAPYAFDGVLKLFLYRETTGWSYRKIARHSHLSTCSISTSSRPNRRCQGRG